jgi:hypothetical protein
VVSGVEIVATDVDRGTTLNTTTNDAGRYSFPNPSVGKYVVSAEMSGLAGVVRLQQRGCANDLNLFTDGDQNRQRGRRPYQCGD